MNRMAVFFCMALLATSAGADTLCRIVSGGGLAFGVYDGMSPTPTDTLSTVTVACDRNGGPRNIVVSMRLGQGYFGSSVQARRMQHTGGGDQLAYGLFRDVSRSSVWGYSDGIDTVTQAAVVPNNGSTSLNFTIYGRIPAQQNVSAGDYTDSVQITLTP